MIGPLIQVYSMIRQKLAVGNDEVKIALTASGIEWPNLHYHPYS